MAAARRTKVVIERVEAVMQQSDYGHEQPALLVSARTAEHVCALRHNYAAGLRAAAEVELALAEVGDRAWLVNPPVWNDERQLAGAWRTTFAIVLEGCKGASAEVAMAALRGVAAKLGGGKGGRR